MASRFASSSYQETGKVKYKTKTTSPEKAQLPVRFCLTSKLILIHLSKAFYFSPFCHQLQLQKSILAWGRHIHIKNKALSLKSGRLMSCQKVLCRSTGFLDDGNWYYSFEDRLLKRQDRAQQRPEKRAQVTQALGISSVPALRHPLSQQRRAQ